MSLTVKDIVELPLMKTSKVRAGQELLAEKTVEWVSVIELPVENFVRKNEFVLSTGMGCEDNPNKLESFVQDVIQSGASVLAIATGRYVFTIPDRVTTLAQENGLIIIDVPWEVRFAEIMQTIMHILTLDKQEERKKAEDVRQELIDCVLQNKGLQEICHSLYKHIRIPVAITDRMRKLRARKYFDKKLLTAYSEISTAQPLQTTSSSDIQFTEHPLYYHLEQFQLDDKRFFQLNIINNHKQQGYIIIQPNQPSELTWFVMNVLEHALTACALYFVKENAIEITEIRLKDNFVLNLAKQEHNLDEQLISRARLLGYQLQVNYACLVGKISYKNPNYYDSEGDSPENSSLQSLNYSIQKEINYAGELLGRQTMTTFDNGEVIIYLEAGEQPDPEIANQFLDTIERRLSELLVGMQLSWGIAYQSDNEFPFHQSYQEAKTALAIGKQQHGPGERTFFSDIKINRLLMGIANDNNIVEIVHGTLAPLLEYDNKRQTDLIHTFLIYNKYKGNVSQTARALNLHRQSLLRRLRNIESLTQLSLMNSDDSFLLELSVRLWMLKNME